jgi:hypothetical protein
MSPIIAYYRVSTAKQGRSGLRSGISLLNDSPTLVGEKTVFRKRYAINDQRGCAHKTMA